MPRIFLSYHSPDEALAAGLKQSIESKNADISVFFAPAHLRAGGFWQKALAEEISAADAFILLVAESGVGDWQELEYFAGLDRRATSHFPLVLLLLQGQSAPGLPFLRQLHWIVTADPTSEKDLGRIIEAASGAGTTPAELWRFSSPYRGLAAMEEKDCDYFFGRERETAEVLSLLADSADRLPVIIGNSGVGKSSLAQAGVLAALKRQTLPEGGADKVRWMFKDSRQWCYLSLKPGTEPLKALVQAFMETWQFEATNPDRVMLQNRWIDLLAQERGSLIDMIDATERRYEELNLSKPPAYFLYIDQGEELYVRAEERQSRRFSALLAQALSDKRLRAMMSLRADFLGELQKDQCLFDVHRKIDMPPLRFEALRQVVNRPAELLSARFENPQLGDTIAYRAAEESTKDAGALPLLSYLLDDMWSKMLERGDGVLRLPHHALDLGRVLVERADKFLSEYPNSEDSLRRILTLKLATVRDGEEPTRRRALRTEFSRDTEWRLICALADHPYRLLVTATPEDGETYVEVAHEALFRRWAKLQEWIAAEREFLAWKSSLEAARRSWSMTNDTNKKEALLMGGALAKAENWFARRRNDLSLMDLDFIEQSIARDRKAKSRVQRVRFVAYAAMSIIIATLSVIVMQSYIMAQYRWWTVERPYILREFAPYVLTAKDEQALKPHQAFRECVKDCPPMIVIPAGSFMMGATSNDPDAQNNELPQHNVTIAKPFAVSVNDVTFEEWDACMRDGVCPAVSDNAFGHGSQPVINITWENAKTYVGWLSNMTGRHYRLLSEAEWEYAARAGTKTIYYWGDAIGKNNADCDGCGSRLDGAKPAPVGSFAPNAYGLYDMAGEVWQWVEDCLRDTYADAPRDGSAWLIGDCSYRVLRGGAWNRPPRTLRMSNRDGDAASYSFANIGMRIARTLDQ